MIFLSIGHYADEPGACFGDFCEHEEAAAWVAHIAYRCQQNGHDVLIVPSGKLTDKVSYINDRTVEGDLAVEMHFNSDAQQAGHGALTLYYPGSVKGKVMAQRVQAAMEPLMGRHWDGAMPGYYRMDPRNKPDYFLRATDCTALILEPAFIHDRQLIESKRRDACIAIADALA